jgi:hypothetical protein
MSSPVESSSVQLHRGKAPDPKVDVPAGNPWILRMAGEVANGWSRDCLVTSPLEPTRRYSTQRLSITAEHANGQRTPALTLHTGQAPQP